MRMNEKVDNSKKSIERSQTSDQIRSEGFAASDWLAAPARPKQRSLNFQCQQRGLEGNRENAFEYVLVVPVGDQIVLSY